MKDLHWRCAIGARHETKERHRLSITQHDGGLVSDISWYRWNSATSRIRETVTCKILSPWFGRNCILHRVSHELAVGRGGYQCHGGKTQSFVHNILSSLAVPLLMTLKKYRHALVTIAVKRLTCTRIVFGRSMQSKALSSQFCVVAAFPLCFNTSSCSGAYLCV